MREPTGMKLEKISLLDYNHSSGKFETHTSLMKGLVHANINQCHTCDTLAEIIERYEVRQ